MTDKEFLTTIIKYKIKVNPIVTRARNHRIVIEKWSAGFQSCNSKGGVNYVKAEDYAQGSSPKEAVENLLNRK